MSPAERWHRQDRRAAADTVVMPKFPHSTLGRGYAALAAVAVTLMSAPFTGLFSERVIVAGSMHALLVGAMAFATLAAALVASRAAWRRHDVRSALAASAFTAIGALLLVHAAATPGGPIFRTPVPNPTVEIAGVFAIPAGALLLLAAMAIPARLAAGRQLVVAVQLATIAVCGAFAVVGLGFPELLPRHPLMLPPASYVVLSPTVLLFAWAGLRAHRTAVLTGRGGDAAMFVGLTVLAAAIAVYITSTPFDAQFWFGHVLELVGLTTISAAVASDLRRPVSSWRLASRGHGSELFHSSEELLGGYVHSLTVALAENDPSTWNHSRRVAELAVEVGEELELDEVTVRRIAVAGLVHDLGKLRIPHEVLHKPGKLTDEEFGLIKSHPVWSVELLAHLRGFERELPIVRGHHEKLSGRGYPDGLAADQIGVETRIMTACDVYDALTDARSYKEPWPVERALALLHEESGSSFDADVVAALERVVLRRQGGTVVPLRPRRATIEPGERRSA